MMILITKIVQQQQKSMLEESSYFDNETVLSQFRLQGPITHTACEYSIDKFGKNIESRK